MKVDEGKIGERAKLLANLIQKDQQEQHATAIITTEILSKLNISIDGLPQKCQELLQMAAANMTAVNVEHLDPVAVSLQHSLLTSKKLNDEYVILKLKQKNTELQVQVDRNNKFLEGMRKELEHSRDSLERQTPSPENIHEHIKQMKQKVASYEESWKKAMMKFSKLSVPDAVLPKSLQAQLAALDTLRDEAAAWRQRADDVAFTRDARDAFIRLRR